MTTKTQHKALFLDRDGIINVDHGYVSTRDSFEFSKGIHGLLKHFKDAGYLLFIVTNQSGIHRGYYSKADFLELTSWMLEVLKSKGIPIEKVYHCPHTPDEQCNCRKPNTGMIEQALLEYPLILERSWMIGDKPSDILLAHNAGINNTIYIGKKCLPNASFSFASVQACEQYFLENTGKI
jgi:D-glycero-D-manno-heptose 1,7-bisphosphate phosphatase